MYTHKKIWMSVILILLVLPMVFSIGIAPGKSTLNYEPGRVETYKVDVINNDGKDFNAVIYVDGELKDYVTVSTNELKFTADEYKKSFTYKVNLPETVEIAGTHTAEIMVTEKVPAEKAKGMGLSANLGVITTLFVNFPYPGKYADAQIRVDNVKMGDEIIFYFKIFNLGDEPIYNTYAKIDIYDTAGELYNRITTDKRAIEEKKYGELVLKVDSNMFVAGDYLVNATIYYDGNEIKLSDLFTIDDFLLDLISISVADYELGGIAPFNVLVKNIGNRLVQDFYTQIILSDSAERIVANVKSYNIDIDKQDIKKTEAFWDTKDIAIGDYEGTIGMYYENEVLEKNINVKVKSDSIDVEIDTPTGLVVLDEKPTQVDSSAGMHAYINSVLLIIVIVFIVITLMRLKKKK